MKTEGSKEHLAYQEAKKNYLAIGKRYSALLREVMQLDPNILKLAEDILITGDNLSAHDNKFLTTFYKELRSKSKIDKKYYDLLLELKKTRNELDHAAHTLSKLRVSYTLRRAGVPTKRSNQGLDAIVSQVNDTNLSLLEKISLPEVLSLEDAEKLEERLVNGDVSFLDGDLKGQTKEGRSFVRTLGTNIQSHANDKYFLEDTDLDIRKYINIDQRDVLNYVRASGDREHVREIERRISAGDISLHGGELTPLTPKGKKYLALLVEELSLELARRVDASLLDANAATINSDPRLNAIKESLNDLDISLEKHSRIGALASNTETYQGLLRVSRIRKEQISAVVADIIMTQETISVSYLDIKKQLLSVVDRKGLDVARLLSLLVAVRYLSVFEKQYEVELSRAERLLGLPHTIASGNTGPESMALVTDRYTEGRTMTKQETSSIVLSAVESGLAKRHPLGADANKALTECLLGSPQARDLEETIHRQESVRRHAVDTLYGTSSLYDGLDNVSEILSELTELEIEKRERLAELIHELELSHKELWITGIKNNNIHYIDTNFDTLSEATKNKTKKANSDAIAAARKEIRDTLQKHRELHRKHSDDFAKTLRDSLSEISKGGDVNEISKALKKKYKDLSANHDEVLSILESDIILLEKRLLLFEEKTPAEIEKMLMSDIRSSI